MWSRRVRSLQFVLPPARLPDNQPEPQAWTTPAPGSRRFRSIRTGKDGAYRTAGLPNGSYYIAAIPDEASSEWIEPKYLEQLARIATEIRMDDGEKRTQNLKTMEVR